MSLMKSANCLLLVATARAFTVPRARPGCAAAQSCCSSRAPPVLARGFDDISPDADADDLYKILGASPDATPAELRQAFRTSARLYHPDVSSHHRDGATFRRVSAAYTILSDPKKREAWVRAKEYSAPNGSHRYRSRPYEYRPPEPTPPNARPWLFDLADSKVVRIMLTLGFIGGQWLTWWLFLFGTTHLPAANAMTVGPVCGFGPCTW